RRTFGRELARRGLDRGDLVLRSLEWGGVSRPPLGGRPAVAFEVDDQLARIAVALDLCVRGREVGMLEAEDGDERRRIAAHIVLVGPLRFADELLRRLDVLCRDDLRLLERRDPRADGVAHLWRGLDGEVVGVHDADGELPLTGDDRLRFALANFEHVVCGCRAPEEEDGKDPAGTHSPIVAQVTLCYLRSDGPGPKVVPMA